MITFLYQGPFLSEGKNINKFFCQAQITIFHIKLFILQMPLYFSRYYIIGNMKQNNIQKNIPNSNKTTKQIHGAQFSTDICKDHNRENLLLKKI